MGVRLQKLATGDPRPECDDGPMAGADRGLEGALEFVGVELGPGDIELLRLVVGAFEPAMAALDGADLSELPLESDLDPSRPPADTAPA
jgi:hypothetical protein